MTSPSTTRTVPTEIMLNIIEHFFDAIVNAQMDERLWSGAWTVDNLTQEVWTDISNYLEVFPGMVEHIRTLLYTTSSVLDKELQESRERLKALHNGSGAQSEEWEEEVEGVWDPILLEVEFVSGLIRGLDEWE